MPSITLDITPINVLLMHLFDGNHAEIEQWKEKSKKWDHYAERIGNYHVSPKTLEEYMEKAELFDILQKTKPEMSFMKAICANCNRGNYPYHCAWNLICEECSTSMKEKAKKLDEFWMAPHLNTIVIPKSDWLETKENSKKWHEFKTELPGYGIHYNIASIREWKGKAQKWDEVYCDDNNMVVSSDLLHSIEEKAKKWDSLLRPDSTECIVDRQRATEWKEKSKKYDELSDDVKWSEKIEKAKMWDEWGAKNIDNQIIEKAKTLDYLNKCHPMITATEIDELKEKAKQFDELAKWFRIQHNLDD